MILCKKLSCKEVLELVGMVVVETIPDGEIGDLELVMDEDGGVEIFFEQIGKEGLN